jgi:hypothetical protein
VVSYAHKMFMKLATGVNNIKFFFSLAIIKQLITTYLEANKLVFVTGMPLQPGLIFARKARSLPRGEREPLRYFNGIASFKKCKQLLEYQYLLLLRHLVVKALI